MRLNQDLHAEKNLNTFVIHAGCSDLSDSCQVTAIKELSQQ